MNNPQPEQSKVQTFLTAKEVQARLRLGKNGPYALAMAREIETVRIRGRILFVAESVEELIRRNTIPAKREFFGTRATAHRQEA